MSTRIELNGQMKIGQIKIERSFPGILNGQMSESEWTNFCDRVDQTLLPIADVRRKKRKMTLIFILLMVIFFGVFAIFITGSGGISFLPFLPVVIIAPFIINVCFMIRMSKKARETWTQLKQVCEDESNRRSNVSFHVRDEKIYMGRSAMLLNYIECSVGTGNYGVTAVPEVGSMFDQMMGNQSQATQDSRSVADRLKDLEGLKPILSEEEYARKRKDILAEV
mmetsp:Transcript_15981/g.15378  ORF Transcript_15981/g.15378 Transcript_15981/m.15378 type:complete len:223 (+) Transcript_15981:57-725(+)